MFEPDYRNMDCARNKKPRRIPLYEHGIDDGIMEGFLGKKFAHRARATRTAIFPRTARFFGRWDTIR